MWWTTILRYNICLLLFFCCCKFHFDKCKPHNRGCTWSYRQALKISRIVAFCTDWSLSMSCFGRHWLCWSLLQQCCHYHALHTACDFFTAGWSAVIICNNREVNREQLKQECLHYRRCLLCAADVVCDDKNSVTVNTAYDAWLVCIVFCVFLLAVLSVCMSAELLRKLQMNLFDFLKLCVSKVSQILLFGWSAVMICNNRDLCCRRPTGTYAQYAQPAVPPRIPDRPGMSSKPW